MEDINNKLETVEINNTLEKKNSQTESSLLINSNNTENCNNTKKKKKKKKIKKQKSKKCKDLKELIEEISKDKKLNKISEKTPKKISEKKEIKNPVKEEEKVIESLYLKNIDSKIRKTNSYEDSDKITDCDLTKENLYETNELYKDEEKNKNDNINLNLHHSNSTKLEFSAEKNRNYINKENEKKLKTKRKMTYSICDYFNGYDKYLSEQQKSTIDLSKSINFIEKRKLNNFFFNNKNDDLTQVNNRKNFFNFKKKKLGHEKNENKINKYEFSNSKYTKFNNDINLKFNLQPLTTNPIIIIRNTKQSKFDNFHEYKMIYDDNKNYFYMTLNINNFNNNNNKKENEEYFGNKSNNKKCNYFIRRCGDWLCKKCGNFNFAFRGSCNKCNQKKPIDFNNKFS